MPDKRALGTIALVVLCLGQWGIRGLSSLEDKSPVWDETMHMDYGFAFGTHGPTFDPADHPYPITTLLTAPLILGEPQLGQDGFLIPEAPQNLLPPRTTNLFLGGVGILLICGLWGVLLGKEMGLLALVFATLDPAWLAQARLLTTDTGFGMFFVLAALAMAVFLQTSQRRWLVGAGLCAGAATLSKFSGLLIAPLLVVLATLHPSGKSLASHQRIRSMGTQAAVLLGSSLGLILAVFISHWAMGSVPLEAGPQHFLQGLERFFEIRQEGRGAMLFGSYSPNGFLGFFPSLLVTKTPLLVLLLIAIAAASQPLRKELRAHPVAFGMPLAFLLASIVAMVNLGYRHLTPLHPALWVLAAYGLLEVKRRLRGAPWITWVLPIALLGEVLGGHPHYLPWSNALVGGVEGAHTVTVDSSTDWGQDLPEVRRFLMREKPESPPHFAYFGTANPLQYGIQAVWRPCGALGRPPVSGQPRAGCKEPADLLLVSASCLEGVTGAGPKKLQVRDNCYDWLREQPPSEVLGGSILVFRAPSVGHSQKEQRPTK